MEPDEANGGMTIEKAEAVIAFPSAVHDDMNDIVKCRAPVVVCLWLFDDRMG